MKKKLISMLLCMCMVMSMLPTAIFAEDDKDLKEISGKINAITEVAESNFGYALSADGNLLAVGANYELLSNGEKDGAVYIYDLTKSEGDTGYERKIVMTNNQNDINEDSFGRDVDLMSNKSGTFLLVGAETLKNEKDLFTGGAFLYDLNKSESEAGFETKLIPSDGKNFDSYGKYVSLNDKYVVVGAYNGGSKGEGAVYVYDRTESDLQASEIKIIPTDGEAGDNFGRVLDLEDDILVVSAYKKSDKTGAVYIYDLTKSSEDAGFEVKVAPNELNSGAGYGKSLAIDNDTLVVGAYYDNNEEGSVYVFDISDLSNITPTLKLKSRDIATGDCYGRSVSLSGDNLVVGAYKADIGGKSDAGAAYLYELSASDVQESEVKFVTDDLQSEDELGRAILIHDKYVFIGAADGDGDSENVGAVYTAYLSIIRDENVTVTFNTDGGSDIEPITETAGNKISVPTAPTKRGFTFGGWYKDSGLKNKFDVSNDIITENTTLYAKWIASAPVDTVVLEQDSLGTAGDSIITGLESGKIYKVIVGDNIKYVKEDGTLSDSEYDATNLKGTKIVNLTNGTTYKVKLFIFKTIENNDGTVTITRYTDNVPNLEIPGTIEGKKVTSIGNHAFYGKSFESITIPKGVKSIGTAAFARNKLKTITIPDSVETIGYNAFTMNKLETVTIPNRVKSIDSSAFANNNLKTVTILDNVKSIGENAFSDNQETSTDLIIRGYEGTVAQTHANKNNYTFECLKVFLAEGSLGTAGDSKVTGLASGKKYKVIIGGDTKYVKADGTLSDNEVDVAGLTKTEITGLTNGTTYKVELYVNVTETPLTSDVNSIESGNIYTINSAEQLKHLSDLVNGGQTCQGATIKLLNNIDISDYDWTPIGGANQFNGEFNGNSHTISGLKIGQAGAAKGDLQYVGLFGEIGNNGYVHDVTIEAEGIYSNYSGEDNFSAGVLAGWNNGTIESAITSGTIECGSSFDGEFCCGGMVGRNEGSIKQSHSKVNVVCVNVDRSRNRIGGLVGRNLRLIDHSYAIGTVQVSVSQAIDMSIGGLVGFNQGLIGNSCATGNTKVSVQLETMESQIGGFVGENSAYIGNSYATGNVTGGTGIKVGGFAGFLMEGNVENCYAVGETCGIDKDSIGGFAGSSFIYQQCYLYYNSESKQTVGESIVSPAKDGSDFVTSKTSNEMKLDEFKTMLNTNRESCFIPEEIKFDEWKRSDDRNNGYPELIGVEIPVAKPKTPSVTTITASNIEKNAATIGGTVTNDGGASITEKGILYSTTVKTPTIDANGVTKVEINSETNSFSKKVSELSANTTYYTRAYAVNSEGTAYGAVQTFKTKKEEEVTYKITGTVSTNDSPLNGVTVVLKKGNHEIGRTTTDTDGKYSFTDLEKGVYNVVMIKGEGENKKTVTSLIVIQNENVTKNVSLPNTNKDSILEVTGDETPEVVVGGLDKVAEGSVEPSVVIKMTVEKKEENTAENATEIKKEVNEKNLDFIDMKVLKITGGTSKAQSEVGNVLEIVIPYDFTGKSDVMVYRYHDIAVNKFSKLGRKPTAPYSDGRYYLDETNGFIYMYTQKFSTYAIGYNTAGQKTITFDANRGTVSSTTMLTETDGKLATLPTPTRSGYDFDGWYTKLSGGTKITSDTVFTVNTTVYAHWTYRSSSSSSRGHSSHKYYDITISVKGEGTITPDGGSDHSLQIRKSNDQTFTITAKKGYEISDVLVDGKSVGSVNKYTLKNIREDHTIKVIFKKETKDDSNKETSSPFIDVSEQNWFYDEVLKVSEKGIITGTSHNKFSPYIGTSRAMIATILYRMENKPSYSKKNPFSDVLENKWYTYGIAWGAEHKIVKGYGEGIFKPDQIVSREELCAILARYAEYKGLDMTQKAELSDFVDENKIGNWAKENVSFTVKVKLMHGNTKNQFMPKNQATRAEVATVICNLLRLIEN